MLIFDEATKRKVLESLLEDGKLVVQAASRSCWPTLIGSTDMEDTEEPC